MKTVVLPGGECVPALGQGTWNMGDRPASRAAEIAALHAGLDLGLTLIDTAEMYGDGRAETLVAEAVAGRRNEAFLVSKVLPSNASRKGTQAACEKSLRRLRTDRLDLYLLHWRGSVPLADTLEGMRALQAAGKIRHYGVSNFDLEDLKEWLALNGAGRPAVNQVLYNLQRRGVEWDLLPYQQQEGIPVMAYSPLEQKRLPSHRGLAALAKEGGMTPAQLALAWLLARDPVIVIPKAASADRVRENAAALSLQLTNVQLQALDNLFPPPRRAQPLAML